MASNLNGTTPAAPSGSINVAFQTDGSGNDSANVPAYAVELTQQSVDLTAQSANISATTLLAVTNADMYRVSGYIIVTQAATVSSTLPSIVITWTDKDNATSQSLTLTATSAGNLLTTFEEAGAVISVAASSNITYATSGYATSGATSMQFSLHIRLEEF